jgi:hypothetical protein
VLPRLDKQPPSEAWRQRLIMGRPLLRMAQERIALVGPVPGLNDQLAACQAFDAALALAGPFLCWLEESDPRQVAVVMVTSKPDWTLEKFWAEDKAMEFEEVIER